MLILANRLFEKTKSMHILFVHWSEWDPILFVGQGNILEIVYELEWYLTLLNFKGS